MEPSVKIKLKCNCGRILSAERNMAGQRGRCKSCGHAFKIPVPAERKTSDHSKLAESATPSSERNVVQWETDATQPAVSFREPGSHAIKRCPECAAEMNSGAALCIRCGYHFRTGRKLKALDAKSLASLNRFAFVICLPFCLLYVFATYLLLDRMDGPMFLQFYFASLCAFVVLVPILRSYWVNSDVFNYLALGTLEISGLVRLGNALMLENYKVSFLLLGMLTVLPFFVLVRTENDNGVSALFRSKQGGLAMLPYSFLAITCVAGLGVIYFVPPVRSVVAELAMAAPAMMGFVTFFALKPSAVKSMASGSSLRGRSGGYLSCSIGSVGGGCGGGGCGGGGCGG